MQHIEVGKRSVQSLGVSKRKMKDIGVVGLINDRNNKDISCDDMSL